MGEIPAFLLEGLRFQGSRRDHLRDIPDSEWSRTLSDWHVVRLTLPLRRTCGDELPEWVRERIDVFLADNELRFERIKEAYSRAAKVLEQAGAEHVVIKGFSLWPGYTEHPKYRPQSDIDLYCRAETILRAQDAFLALGYTTQPKLGQTSTEHLWSLNPSHSWTWNGNHFDPAIPISLELHFSWWDAATTRIHPQGLEKFWSRRLCRNLGDLSFPALEPADNLAYTSLNLLRNLLNNLPAAEQVYGLARFLHTYADDGPFWQKWCELHHDSLRHLEAVTFLLASEWFACRLSEQAQEEVNRLPLGVHQFFRHFAKSTLSTGFNTAKDGVWLHLDLLASRNDKLAVLFQRIVPVLPRKPPVIVRDEDQGRSVNAPSSCSKPETGWSVKYIRWLVERSFHHLLILPLALWHGLHYQLSRRNLGRPFWTFFAASFCFDLGMTMYFFLYNIYLLDRGFKEDFLGWMISAMNIGTIVCSIPAAVLIQRLGIRRSLLTCIATLSAVLAARALLAPRAAILSFALFGGGLTTIWAVAISPTIALLTDEQSRPFGFSVVFSSGIGVGILANLAASYLPGFLTHFSPAMSGIRGRQVVLLIAAAIVALGLIPLSRLRIEIPPSSSRKLYPRSPFLLRFLPAVALWSLVTGSLSPLANVYFSQYFHTPLERIGTIFSFSNLFQVLGILVAPVLFKKLGVVPGVASSQLVAALLLGFLAGTSGALPASVIYVVFTGFLWMSEPGMFSLLMTGVAPEERAGASALNFLVISLVQAGAVAATGTSFARFGYPTVLATIAMVGALAAVAFWFLLGRHALSGSKV